MNIRDGQGKHQVMLAVIPGLHPKYPVTIPGYRTARCLSRHPWPRELEFVTHCVIWLRGKRRSGNSISGLGCAEPDRLVYTVRSKQKLPPWPHTS
jgi:hypothetical protein